MNSAEVSSPNTAEILGGAETADAIKRDVAAEVARLEAEHGFRPCLAAVRIGDDPASAVYVGNKIKTSQELGLISEHHALSANATREELLSLIDSLNKRNEVDGILVQLPLPKGLDEKEILEAIDPEKDVDGFHPMNVGRLVSGQGVLAPCTPAGIIELLRHNNIEIAGAHAVVVGRSNIVGKPMAQLLLQNDATVTICHSRTKNLVSMTRQADILVAAIGRAGFIRGEHIKPGAVVIDVGMNKVEDEAAARALFDDGEIDKRLAAIAKRGFTLVGDVNPAEAKKIAGKFTPVPGGVGLLTVAMLMKNTVTAAKRRRKI
ncbi:MAG TPA: bifunctional methylenetetrahydrofolate dehydrogenase/methenyltetrahydrofolate cyclohydrolase FolD [Pyrinomonadaceae bacterium]|jgi:methylenetetrahydrofolate dehydrogenase (NADP+)/methenyltetrahydrofolate cyclohydrolase|nr:bifunctional methylenetetrahydrofolate dehydrogenase/methenyltetrahydrofolate cyclohydrolase FolD [Pyrinomonadaceae bacterium]